MTKNNKETDDSEGIWSQLCRDESIKVKDIVDEREIEGLHEETCHTGWSHPLGPMSPYHSAQWWRPKIDLGTHTILESRGQPPRSLSRLCSPDLRGLEHLDQLINQSNTPPQRRTQPSYGRKKWLLPKKAPRNLETLRYGSPNDFHLQMKSY